MGGTRKVLLNRSLRHHSHGRTTRTDTALARVFASYYHFDTRYLNEYGTN
jgi:hypothetical protein